MPVERHGDVRTLAGVVVWPSGPSTLTDRSLCPACFAPVPPLVCQSCGLDLNHPAAGELRGALELASSALDRRVEVVGRMRFETDERAAALAAAARAAVRAPSPATAVGAAPACVAPAPADVAPKNPAAPSPQRRVSNVQLILLIVGVSALSVGAIFFLVYAFINYGVYWRSALIAVITAAAIVGASMLRRRGLRTTAEGIACFAIVLVYLDAFAIRANGFFGADGVDGAAFWGATLAASAAGFVAWSTASRLRAPSIVAFTTFAPGVGLLAWAAAATTPDWPRLGIGFLALGAAGTVHRLAGHRWATTGPARSARAERSIALIASLLGLAGASYAAVGMIWFLPVGESVIVDGPVASAITFCAIGLVAALHLLVLGSMRGPRPLPFPEIFAGALGVAFAITGTVATASGSVPSAVLVPTVIAVAVAVCLETGARRLRGGFIRRSAAIAAVAALVVAVVVAARPMGIAASGLLGALVGALERPWTSAANAVIVPFTDELAFAVLTLGTVVALGAVGAAAGGILRRRLPALAWLTAAILVLAAPLLGSVVLVSAGWLALAAVAIAVLLTAARPSGDAPHGRSMLRPQLITMLAVAAAAGWTLAWASEATWAPAAAITIGLTLGVRAVAGNRGSRAALLGLALVLVLVSAAAAARQLELAQQLSTGDGPARSVGLVAVLALGLSTIPLRRLLGELDRRTVFWISLAASGGTAVWLHLAAGPAPSIFPDLPSRLALHALLVGVLLLWTALPSTVGCRAERATASVAIVPATLFLLVSIALVLDAPDLAVAAAPVTAAVLASTGSLAIALTRTTRLPRVVRDLGVLLVGLPAVAGALMRQDESTWLVLVLASVATLLLGTSEDGLFASRSPRRDLGWVAVALATGGLWVALGDRGVTAVEPWVLPLSGVLFLIALLLWRAERRAGGPSAGLAAPVVALAALAASIVPVAVAAADGALTRAVIVGAISATLLLTGTLVVGRGGIRPYLDAAALAGAIGVIVTAVGRAANSVADGAPGGELEAWLGLALIVLIAAGFGLSRSALADAEGDAFARQRLVASQALAIVALTAVVLSETLAIDGSMVGLLRALGATLVFCAIHVVAFLIDRAPFTRLLAWLALGYASTAAAVGVLSGALEPVEIATVPVAIALLATGAVRLIRDEEARSWPWLGPGVILLLVPSLVATLDTNPLWRLVGLGVVGIAIVIFGAVRRLQAPFVIAGVVVLVHVIATFAPQIRAAYGFFPWWLWLAVGGVVLIGLAARYEQRLQNVRGVVLKIGALR